jgi:hypothetical protein
MYLWTFSDLVTALTARRVRHGVALTFICQPRPFLAPRKAVRMEYTELIASIQLTSIRLRAHSMRAVKLDYHGESLGTRAPILRFF